MERKAELSSTPRQTINSAILAASLVGLYFTSHVNYLLFHSLAEIFSIVVAFTLFAITWHSRRYIANPYLLFIGIAYLFIGGIDLLHTLSYKGMPIFTDYDYYANQLWIGARYLESLTLLIAFVFLYRDSKVNPYETFAFFTLITVLLVASVFVWKNFPVCFVAGKGLTPFKKISEYIICAILAVNILLLFRNRDKFEPAIFTLLLWSLICTIISELAFTFYISNYGISNMVGHYFKIFSFFLVYLAIIKTGIENPFRLIFRDLDTANRELQKEILARKETEAELANTIVELKKAFAEVKTLSGMLPICSGCKKIRDDKGYWQQIEAYISAHSEADFSHGICPECIARLYPDLELSKKKRGG
jgi:hypothetical protein